MSEKDGGPAFPETAYYDDKPYGSISGMSLRDYFAGQALQGFLAAAAHPQSVGITDLDSPKLAHDSYALADAMLAERDKS